MKHILNYKTLIILSGLTFLLLGGVVGCGRQETTPAEIKIGIITALSGENEAIGQATVEAAELAVKAVNEAGGLQVGNQKVKVVLVIEDHKDQAAAAVAAARKLINQDNVMALTGIHISRNAIPVADIAESSRIPMISGQSTNPQTTAGKQYVFRVAFLDTFQGQVLAGFTRNELNKTKAAVLYDEASAYNKELAEIYKQSFEVSGGQVVAFESYITGQKDFSTQLAVIKESDAEILFLPNYHNEVPLQVQQAREMGLTIPVLGSDSWGILQREDLPVMEGGYFTTHFATDIEGEIAQKFVADYREAYGKDPTDMAASTYDAMGILFKAITSQGKTDPESIRQGIATIGRYQGVTGEIQYQDSGDPVKSAVILQIKDGVIKFYKFAGP